MLSFTRPCKSSIALSLCCLPASTSSSHIARSSRASPRRCDACDPVGAGRGCADVSYQVRPNSRALLFLHPSLSANSQSFINLEMGFKGVTVLHIRASCPGLWKMLVKLCFVVWPDSDVRVTSSCTSSSTSQTPFPSFSQTLPAKTWFIGHRWKLLIKSSAVHPNPNFSDRGWSFSWFTTIRKKIVKCVTMCF